MLSVNFQLIFPSFETEGNHIFPLLPGLPRKFSKSYPLFAGSLVDHINLLSVVITGLYVKPSFPGLPSGPRIFVAATAPVSEPIFQESIPLFTEGLYVKPLFPGRP